MRSLCFRKSLEKQWPSFLSTEGDKKDDKKVGEEVHE